MTKNITIKRTLSSVRRKKIWSIESCWICSVVGTCFRRSELRQMARKKQYHLHTGDGDYLLHTGLIKLASSRSPTSRALNKILDKKYKAAINRYINTENEQDILELWEEDIQRGNVPGAYWAIMTLPDSSDTLIEEIYGQVHMMGHDTHGDYQKDNRLLKQLKGKVVSLNEVINNERRQYRQKMKSLEKELLALSKTEHKYLSVKTENTRLKTTLDKAIGAQTKPTDFQQQLDELRQDNANLWGRIDNLTTVLQSKKEMLNSAAQTIAHLKEIQEQHGAENKDLRQEIISLETALSINLTNTCSCANCEDQNSTRCPGQDLCGKTVLYIGGRQNLTPMYRKLIEKHGGRFLHHDGGVEAAIGRLPKMLTGADLVVCPIDCISHSACRCAKKICKRYQKPFVMMRSSGLSSLARGLSEAIQ